MIDWLIAWLLDYNESMPLIQQIPYILAFCGVFCLLMMIMAYFVPEEPKRDEAPHCLKCGYSLRGLQSTRCPECGDTPTLEQLFLKRT